MKLKRMFFTVLLILATGGVVSARDTVKGLDDLIGARGRSGEQQMEERGYRFVRTEKSDDSAWSYWRERGTGKCVSVRTTQGRYGSIVYAPDFNCRQGDKAAVSGAGAPGGENYESVCGVKVNTKTHRYRCQVEDTLQDGRKVRTILHYPDTTMELLWKDGDRVTIRTEGLADRQADYTWGRDEISFSTGDRSYFYISNREKARQAVLDLHD